MTPALRRPVYEWEGLGPDRWICFMTYHPRRAVDGGRELVGEVVRIYVYGRPFFVIEGDSRRHPMPHYYTRTEAADDMVLGRHH